MKYLFITVIVFFGFLINTNSAFAETREQCLQRTGAEYNDCARTNPTDQNHVLSCVATLQGAQATCNQLPSGGATVTTPASSTGMTAPVTLTNPLGTTDIRFLIARLIKAVLSIIGVIALLMFVYGGFLWMISAGNEKQVEKGKEVLKWTTLGILLIVSAYVIVNALFRAAFTGGL